MGGAQGSYPSALNFNGLRAAAVAEVASWFEEANADCLEMGRLALIFATLKATSVFTQLMVRPAGPTFVNGQQGGRLRMGAPRGRPRAARGRHQHGGY